LNHPKAKQQFDDYWRQTIEVGRKDAVIAEQAQKVSQRSNVSARVVAAEGGGETKRKTARHGL
jgi:hypothetical protein